MSSPYESQIEAIQALLDNPLSNNTEKEDLQAACNSFFRLWSAHYKDYYTELSDDLKLLLRKHPKLAPEFKLFLRKKSLGSDSEKEASESIGEIIKEFTGTNLASNQTSESSVEPDNEIDNSQNDLMSQTNGLKVLLFILTTFGVVFAWGLGFNPTILLMMYFVVIIFIFNSKAI